MSAEIQESLGEKVIQGVDQIRGVDPIRGVDLIRDHKREGNN
jgi:hypothetical protein